MPGDKIDIEVFAKYLDPNSANWTAAMTSFMAAIAGGTAPAGTVVDGGLAGSLGNGTFPFPSVLVRNNDNGTGPKGYLNYLVFDRNYVYKDGGFRRLSTTARETGTDTPHERLAFDGASQILIKEPGYVYIWLSNENETAVEVYFDDFKVTHTKSPVIQEDDYYPFGLTFNSYSRESSAKNNNLYNGKELQDELNLGWYDYQARQYDPAIGRWIAIDPLADLSRRWSSYTYCYNSPLLFIDPDGMFGDYYDSDGKHLGNDGIDDKKVYLAESVKRNEEGIVTEASGSTDLGVTHDDFATSANVVMHESSGNKEESLWTAHAANNAKDNDAIDWKKKNTTLKDQLTDKAYSTTPESARTPLSTSDNSNKANNARSAVIDVLNGGADPTGGAVLWDGSDFISKGNSHNKFKEYSEISIDANHLDAYAQKQRSINILFVPDLVFLTNFHSSGNGKYYSLQSTGAKGKSIFWNITPKR